jgi:hypothetical protein
MLAYLYYRKLKYLWEAEVSLYPLQSQRPRFYPSVSILKKRIYVLANQLRRSSMKHQAAETKKKII